MHDPQIAMESDDVQLTVNSYRVMLQDSSPTVAGVPKHRKTRAKRHQAWEQLDSDSGGTYSSFFRDLLTRYPELSMTELIVAALIKGMLQSHEISQGLSIHLKTVENHRNRIRRKLGLCITQNLQKHLISQI